MPIIRSRSGGERWSGTDPNLRHAVLRLFDKIDTHINTTAPVPWDVHVVREGRDDAFGALVELAEESGVAGNADTPLRSLVAGPATGDAEQARRQLAQVLQLLETMTPLEAAHRVGQEDVRDLVCALKVAEGADAPGAEVMAITGAHAVLNLMRCGTSEEAVQLEFVETAGEEGALDLAVGWLDKHCNIDVAVAASCWLVAFLVQSEANIDRMMLLSSHDDEARQQRTQEVLDLFTGAIERHPESEQVVEAAVLALLAMTGHEAGVMAVAEYVGLEWCVQGLEWHSSHQSSSMGMKDAFGRLAYRIAQCHQVPSAKALVERDGLRRLAAVCLSDDQPTLEQQPGSGSAAAMDAVAGQDKEEAAEPQQRRHGVDFELQDTISVVMVDIILGVSADQNVYICEVFQGNERIWHVRKMFLELSVLDKVLRPAAQLAGVQLPELPTRWTLGKSQAAVRDERAPRLQQYLQVVVGTEALADLPELAAFFEGAAAPIRPAGAESYQLGLAATMLVILHFPPSRHVLQADQEEWLPTVVGNMLRTMAYNVGSPLVQMVWTAALGVIASYTNGKHVVRKLGAADHILVSMEVHEGSEDTQEIGCFALCVATRGLRAEDGHIMYGERGMAAALTSLHRFPLNIDVCTGACAAVWAMAFKNNDVRDWAAQPGLFEMLVQVLKNHPGEVKLLSHACVAIGNLAANHRGNQDQVGEVGGIEAVVEELRLHIAHSAVCYTASSALHSALDNHEQNSKRFQQCGGIALFEDIVVEHQDPKINRTVEEMMSVLMLDEDDLRPKCIFDEILQPPAAAEGLLGFMAKKLSGLKRPKGAQRAKLKQWLESSFAFGIIREDLRTPLIETLCDEAVYLHTIEADTTTRFCTEAQLPSKTGIMAMMGMMDEEEMDETVETVRGWPLVLDYGACGISMDEPDADEQAIGVGSMLLSMSSTSATRIRTGGQAGRLWVIDEDRWEWTSSELLKESHGVSRLLKVLSAVPTLSTLSPFQLLGLGLQMVEETFEPKTKIFEEGAEEDSGVYVVQTGAVQLSCKSISVEMEKKVAGQAFGLDGPLATCPRNVTATATDVGTTVLRMSKAAAADGLNFYLDVNDPQSTVAKLARMLPNGLIGLAVRAGPTAANDKRAFGAMMRPLGQARAKSEFMRAVRSFVTYCGQPITVSNILDEPTLAQNVNDHQLRVDLDREEAVVVTNADSWSRVIPGSKFVCGEDAAAWASEVSGEEGNVALREVLIAACRANNPGGGDAVDEAKLGELSRLVHSCCDRTNSAGDAFVKLQEIFLTGMISITPADHSENLCLEIAWDGKSRYIRATSKNVFQITSLDPMSNDAAWFRCKCVSTGLIHIAPDVCSPAESPVVVDEAVSEEEPSVEARAAQDDRLQKLAGEPGPEEPEPEPEVEPPAVGTPRGENLVDMAGRLILVAIEEGVVAQSHDGYAADCYAGYRAAAEQIVEACPVEPTESELRVCSTLEQALVTSATQDQEETSAWTMRDAFDQVIGTERLSQDEPPLRAMSPPTGKIGADLDMMGMSPTPFGLDDEEQTADAEPIMNHLQHLHIFVEYGSGMSSAEDLQDHIVSSYNLHASVGRLLLRSRSMC